jgi:4-diphosphocytidyl-2-C-methyl-D-erythritol kinase
MRGPTAALAGDTGDNLVLKAARALSGRVKSLREGRFVLTKLLPVAAGLGGGSSDAAAALRLLARANKLLPGDPRLFAAARATGADVPVCLDPRPRVMRGIGDVLSEPLDLPQLPAVLVNPGVAVATKDVFIALARKPGELMAAASLDPAIIPRKRDELIAFLARQVNDLEPAAIKVEPTIGKVLAALRALPGCRLARMSGSGATCFALFDTNAAAISGARQLREKQSGWWIRATVLGAAAE